MSKTCVIVGGTAGVGLVTAQKFAKEDYNIVVIGRKNLEEAVTALNNVGTGTKLAIKSDVTVDAEVQAAFDEIIAVFKHIDVIVLNAGMNRPGNLDELSDDHMQQVFNVNVFGLHRWIRRVAPHMRARQQGQFVFTSSVAGFRSAGGNAAYCGSKFALEAMVDALRDELKGSMVRAGSVCPACINTDWWAEESRGGRENSEPMPREQMISPQAVADSIYHMASQPRGSDVRRIVIENHF